MDCKHKWDPPFGQLMPMSCPKCHSKKIKTIQETKDKKSDFGLSPTRKGPSAGRKGRFWQEEVED
jgi:hypothetical protein